MFGNSAHTKVLASVIGMAFALTSAIATAAGAEEWQLVRPSNTGIPGEQVLFATFDPGGNMWVAARLEFLELIARVGHPRSKFAPPSQIGRPASQDGQRSTYARHCW